MKPKIKALKREIEKKKQELAKVQGEEEKIRQRWTLSYTKTWEKVRALYKTKNHATVKAQALWKKVMEWPDESPKITATRDDRRLRIANIKAGLEQLGLELARAIEQEYSGVNATDEVVTQVFSLNDTVLQAASRREECLKRHVFPRLINENGKLSSQVSFTSSDGLRRVVAMVNTMTIVLGELANNAQDEIQRFFDKFQQTQMDPVTQAMYELTKQILVEKTKFKVGPDLYRFLGMELDEDIFPELALAQRYLRQSIRSEKTNSYIRLYERRSMSDKWEVVPQS
jgi:methyl-accepting chemotaxis protein